MASRIGIIGIGTMGSAIATRLMECGHTVILCNRTSDKLAPFVEKGAIAKTLPSEVAAAADVVILSLNSTSIVEQVVFGAAGIAEGGRPGQMIIDMSSIDPAATVEMAERLHASSGMTWVDSPLSGGANAALNGRMTLMMGGTEDDVFSAMAVLDDVAANMTRMGGIGSGQTTKLINQVLCACSFLAVAETTRLALDGGIDAALIPKALAGGRADSLILQEYMPKMAARDLSPTGRIDNMLKDLEAVQRYATPLGTPMPLTGLVTQLHRMLLDAGYGPADSAAYMKLFDLPAPANSLPTE
jgi:2-hydroxy-3-oxopropionate reductase